MREKIFKRLHKKQGEFISGEYLSEQLNISRAAVSKHIFALKADGATIESVQHKGHKLVANPDRLKKPYVLPLLKHANRIATYSWYDTIGSTNDVLKQEGDMLKEISICTCEHQPIGKGRRGRTWVSSKHQGIYVSFLLKPNIATKDAFKITTIAAIAQIRTFKKILGLSAKIKWPNDVMFNGKKLSGTLTELSADFDGVNYIVCGVGINVNQANVDFTQDIRQIATSLNIATGKPVERLALFAAFIDEFIACYDAFCVKGLAPFIKEYTTYSACMGKRVNILGEQTKLQGTVEGFDEDGALLLNVEGTVKKILAGEVSLRGVDEHVQ